MAVQPNEIVKAVMTHVIGDETISQSVWYWWLDSAAEVAYATILAQVLAKVEAIYGELNSYIHSTTALTSLIAHVWEWNSGLGRWDTGNLIGVDTATDAFAGAVTAFPNAVAGVMTAFTQDVNVRARKSFGGLVETFATENEVEGSPLVAMAAALVEWLTVIDLGGGDILWPVCPDKTGVARVLLYGLVSGLSGTQRQRKPGEGI